MEENFKSEPEIKEVIVKNSLNSLLRDEFKTPEGQKTELDSIMRDYHKFNQLYKTSIFFGIVDFLIFIVKVQVYLTLIIWPYLVGMGLFILISYYFSLKREGSKYSYIFVSSSFESYNEKKKKDSSLEESSVKKD